MTTARWIEEFHRQVRRGKHVLLYGNVQDQVLYDGRYFNLSNTLDLLLERQGYEVRAHYDLSDGVTFPAHGMRQRFEDMLRPASPPVAAEARYGPVPARSSGAPYLLDLDVAMPAFRTALAQAATPTAVILDFTDKLATSQEHQPLPERIALVRIRKMATEAARHTRGAVAGQRNLVVLIAPVLGQVPSWLYRDNPFFHSIPVERPQADERKYFLQQFHADFHGVDGETPSDALLDEFADLTDGMAHWDLDSLRLTSVHEQIPIAQTRVLVDFFKHGKREDPWETLDRRRITEAESRLKSRVIGQESAVRAILAMLTSARVGIQLGGATGRSARPKGVFFFVGPTGVGKTELAKSMAELIFGDESAFARFDMSEYSQEHAAEKLTGAPPSYVGYEAGGQLTNSMKRKPFTLVLFDEIEKAHPRLMDKFLQVLDDGRLTDGQGETVYFGQSVIVFTSNLGSTRRLRQADGTEVAASALSPDMDYAAVSDHYRRAVDQHFRLELGRPEILNRLGENVIVFDMLRPDFIPHILRKFLSQLAEQALARHGIVLEFDPSVERYVVAECTKPDRIMFGGRGIRNMVEKALVPEINRYVFLADHPLRRIQVAWDGRLVLREPGYATA